MRLLTAERMADLLRRFVDAGMCRRCVDRFGAEHGLGTFAARENARGGIGPRTRRRVNNVRYRTGVFAPSCCGGYDLVPESVLAQWLDGIGAPAVEQREAA